MRSGELRHLLTFQEKAMPEPQNSFGEAVEIWADAFQVWGAFEPANSREFPANQKRYEETTARFRIRYRPNIDPDQHRIVFIFDYSADPLVQRIFNITRPIPVAGKWNELHIEAKEVTYP